MKRFHVIDAVGLGIIFSLLVLMGYVIGVQIPSSHYDIGSLSDVVVAFGTLLLVFAALQGLGEYQDQIHYRNALGVAEEMYSMGFAVRVYNLLYEFNEISFALAHFIFVTNEKPSSNRDKYLIEYIRLSKEKISSANSTLNHMRSIYLKSRYFLKISPVISLQCESIVKEIDALQELLAQIQNHIISVESVIGSSVIYKNLLKNTNKYFKYDGSSTYANPLFEMGINYEADINRISSNWKATEYELERWISGNI